MFRTIVRWKNQGLRRYYDSLLLFVDNHVSAKVKSLHDAVCINLKEIFFYTSVSSIMLLSIVSGASDCYCFVNKFYQSAV